jgi:uncharacterized membrane protein
MGPAVKDAEGTGGNGIGLLLLGAAAMYLLDPVSGRRRRARLRDKWVHSTHKLRDAERVALVDTAHRVSGLVARAQHLVRHDDENVDDAVVIERVRAALGRCVSHPHAIEVSANRGVVTLKGVILADELQPLLRTVERVRGVKAVESFLTAYPEPDGISSLQGGTPRSGPQAEWRQRNWSPAARLLAATAGSALVIRGLRRTGARGLALRALGAALVARAAANRRVANIVGLGKCEGILIEKALHIAAPPERVFEYWRGFENFPQWMSHVIEVRSIAPGQYRWVVDGPGGIPVEWDSELLHVEQNVEMAWRSRPGSIVRHAGRVRFDPAATGTRVQVQLCYVPIGGVLGHALAKAFGSDPKTEMDDDLMRLKTLIETGRPAHDAAARRLHRRPLPSPDGTRS